MMVTCITHGDGVGWGGWGVERWGWGFGETKRLGEGGGGPRYLFILERFVFTSWFDSAMVP